MNVSSQSLRRRKSLTVPSGHNHNTTRPSRRALTFKKRLRSSLDLKSAPSANDRSSSSNKNKRRHITNNLNQTENSLDGVVACLSGQTEDAKNRIHDVIKRNGGLTMGDFDTSFVTHLILDAPVGSKYDFWKSHSNHHWAKNLAVVTSSWIEACEREGKRVLEEKYKLRDTHSINGELEKDVTKSSKKHEDPYETPEPMSCCLPKEICHASLEEKCDWMLQHPAEKYSNLFSRQSFIMVGFDNDCDTNADKCDPVDCSRLPSKKQGGLPDGLPFFLEEYKTLKGKVSKIIRRAGGTIFWEPTECITAVVLTDNYSKHAWDDVRYFCREHPRGPICISVDWILVCIYHNTIVSSTFPPEPQVQKLEINIRSNDSTNSNNTGSVATRIKSSTKSKQPTSSIFRGDIFAVLLKSMPGTLDFILEEIESSIITNGGLVLSKPILSAVKKDVLSTPAESSTDRKYFVVTSRWFQLDFACPYPLLAELSKLGIKVVLVSPVWVAACIENSCKYDPEDYPLLFQPQTWSIRHLNLYSEHGQRKFLISVTGFIDSSRYGIMSMLKEIGAEFTDNLSRKNTHLICKEAQGQKYTKALEWGLHAVSIEWLYHIIRYGFQKGSEDKFSLAERKLSEKMPRPKAEDQLQSQLSPRRRGKRDPPQSSPKDHDPPLSPTKNDPGKRLNYALQTLEAPFAQTLNTMNMMGSPRRRSKRDRSPLKTNHESPSLLSSSQLEEKESPQIETQYTVGTTLAADADIGGMAFNKRHRFSADSSEDVPLSQANDAEDNGESQVVWFAASRG
mmetsp:Transcript_25585/g.61520  ORF Transcript_25585/g.61520 Transcript_25585/m.61520 type:complete len:790 (+) Transcript_25585:82-2451(+)